MSGADELEDPCAVPARATMALTPSALSVVTVNTLGGEVVADGADRGVDVRRANRPQGIGLGAVELGATAT